MDFSGDKRGRLQELLAVLLGSIPPSLSKRTIFLQDELGQTQPSGALKILSARVVSPCMRRASR